MIRNASHTETRPPPTVASSSSAIVPIHTTAHQVAMHAATVPSVIRRAPMARPTSTVVAREKPIHGKNERESAVNEIRWAASASVPSPATITVSAQMGAESRICLIAAGTPKRRMPPATPRFGGQPAADPHAAPSAPQRRRQQHPRHGTGEESTPRAASTLCLYPTRV